jgi:6-pyruvoyltetrahydropterin/6-carboxytetrahydropterin synthase
MSKQTLVTKKFEFSASHRYWRNDWTEKKNKEVFGICNEHGHNYELHVTIGGKVNPKTGLIINISELKNKILDILEEFDHKNLNLDPPYFKEKIPTTENIANVIFNLIEEKIHTQNDFYLAKLRLYEKRDLYVDVVKNKN